MASVSNYDVRNVGGLLSVRGGGLSVQGVRRGNNEDCCAVDLNGRFFMVADGIGGSMGGEVASRIACDLLTDELARLAERHRGNSFSGPEHAGAAELRQEIQEELLAAVKLANDAIMSERRHRYDCCEMGCTVVAVIVIHDEIYLASMGDSRAYLICNGEAKQLTRDHTITAGLVDMGLLTPEQAATHEYRNTLYKHLGGWCDSDPADIQVVEVQSADCLVLVTDGVTDCVSNDEIAAVCSSFAEPEHAAAELIGTAMENGAGDDMTCVVVYFQPCESGNEQ